MRLALGTVQFGLNYGVSNQQGQVSKTQIEEILEQALSLGIDTLDCAAVYGESEQVLGKLTASSSFNIITKIPPLNHQQDSLLDYFEQSLKNLQQKQVHGLLMHQANDLITHPERDCFFQQLQRLKQQGKVKQIGVSVYSPEQLQQIAQHFPINLAQVPVNVFDQRFLTNETIDLCSQKNIKLHARSLFLQGLVFINEQDLPNYFAPYKAKIAEFSKLAKYLACSKLTLALAIVAQESLNLNNVFEKLVIGICNCQQLNEVVQAYQQATTLAVTIEELAALEDKRLELINPSLWAK